MGGADCWVGVGAHRCDAGDDDDVFRYFIAICADYFVLTVVCVGGTKGAKTLAQARANQVSKFLNQYLSVSVSASGTGIADIAKGSKKPLSAARKAQVSVS